MSLKQLIAVTLLAFSWWCSITEACTCIRKNTLPRNVGCKDQFMAVLNVTGEEHNGHQNGYRFKLIEDYTPSLATPNSVTKFSEILSTSSIGACGLHLQVNSTYLIKGHVLDGELHINMCTTYAKILTQVPTAQESKAMLFSLYKELC